MSLGRKNGLMWRQQQQQQQQQQQPYTYTNHQKRTEEKANFKSKERKKEERNGHTQKMYTCSIWILKQVYPGTKQIKTHVKSPAMGEKHFV